MYMTETERDRCTLWVNMKWMLEWVNWKKVFYWLNEGAVGWIGVHDRRCEAMCTWTGNVLRVILLVLVSKLLPIEIPGQKSKVQHLYLLATPENYLKSNRSATRQIIPTHPILTPETVHREKTIENSKHMWWMKILTLFDINWIWVNLRTNVSLDF